MEVYVMCIITDMLNSRHDYFFVPSKFELTKLSYITMNPYEPIDLEDCIYALEKIHTIPYNQENNHALTISIEQLDYDKIATYINDIDHKTYYKTWTQLFKNDKVTNWFLQNNPDMIESAWLYCVIYGDVDDDSYIKFFTHGDLSVQCGYSKYLKYIFKYSSYKFLDRFVKALEEEKAELWLEVSLRPLERNLDDITQRCLMLCNDASHKEIKLFEIMVTRHLNNNNRKNALIERIFGVVIHKDWFTEVICGHFYKQSLLKENYYLSNFLVNNYTQDIDWYCYTPADLIKNDDYLIEDIYKLYPRLMNIILKRLQPFPNEKAKDLAIEEPEIFMSLLDNKNTRFSNKLLSNICDICGDIQEEYQIKIITTVIKKGYYTSGPEDIKDILFFIGYEDISKQTWLCYLEHCEKIHPQATYYAAFQGGLWFLQTAVEKGVPIHKHAILYAIINDDIECFRYLYKIQELPRNFWYHVDVFLSLNVIRELKAIILPPVFQTLVTNAKTEIWDPNLMNMVAEYI